jgi:hypothetical protein
MQTDLKQRYAFISNMLEIHNSYVQLTLLFCP